MTYCTKCGKPTNNGIMCEDCIISDSPWLLAMKRKEDDLVEQIEQLKAENAALRERLDKSVELPSEDRVWFITEDEEGEESYIISKPTDRLTVDELYEIGKKYFTTREAAEVHLAESNREK